MRRAPARRTRDEYDIGWGKPPKSTRWKPGQSGNPNGRPRPKKNHQAILTEALGQKIRIEERGSVRLVTVGEAIVKRLTTLALKGNLKAIEWLMDNAASLPEPVDAPQDTKDMSPEEIQRIYLKTVRKIS